MEHLDLLGLEYFGLIFVFLRSKPTNEVPRGMITPPLILLNL